MKINFELAEKILVGFIRDEVEKIGLKNVVVGLSGGIDSALSTALAAKALGPERVFAVGMPYETSSPLSMEHARLVADTFKVNFDEVDITPLAKPYFGMNPEMNKLRMGNVMARMRMVVLFDLSAAHQGLVLGTSNKTELLLGYGTWYGDIASALNPIGDLYKTQVWALSEYLGVPQAVIDKKPTADLWAGQSDEEELGFTYADVDALMDAMVDQRMLKPELIEQGFSEQFIDTVAEKIRRNQFKRQIPLIAKLSNRTIGRDFRYSRDWGY